MSERTPPKGGEMTALEMGKEFHMEQQLHVRIVPMTADHLDEVAELERICFSAPWSRNMLAEELDNALSAFLVALDGGGRSRGVCGASGGAG